MKKLTDERLSELKMAANAKGKKTYEIMTNEELAAYKVNCLEAIERSKKSLIKFDGPIMASISNGIIDHCELALRYIEHKLEGDTIKTKTWKDVKVGDKISLYNYHSFKENEVLSIELTPSGKSVKVELSSGWKGTYRTHTDVYYK